MTSASSSTFSSCMHDQMLESNRDDVKLEAMRCVTVMTAKGKLTVPRTLFPHIVKNVSSKNPELKKLIYLYLTNFADQEPDLALLPVATLQKSLKSPNPLIRSSALKVLTSMRLNILSTILMATLKISVNDLSPYVRKTVAHSIIKIYRLDSSLRPDLVEYIERLFNDKNSMVLSSAVASFEVVCPEKLDLVHKHYRRLCFVLADCNEWGQTVLLNLLMRYVIETYGKDGKNSSLIIKEYNPTEHDPKILLRSAKPLVHSNNSAVVMAVIKLYIAIANFNEVRSTITRPLIRLLYRYREIELMALKMIEDLTSIKDGEEEHLNDKQENNQDEDDEVEDEKIREEEMSKLTHNGELKREISVKENGKMSEYEEIKPIDETQNDSVIDETYSQEKSNHKVLVEAESEEKNIDTNVKDEGHDEDEEESDEEGSGTESEENSDDSDEDSNEDSSSEEEEDEEETGEESESETEIIDSKLDSNSLTNSKPVFDSSLIDFSANKDPGAFREVFRPYIKSFFIKYTDCTQIRLAKLRILTNLSSSVNVTLILKELQAYISAYVDDKEFVSAAIHAIGRCAILVKEIAHTCLNGLTTLLSNNNEHIVSEAIVVLRSQIINKKSNKKLNKSNNGTHSNIKTNNNDNNENDKNTEQTINEKESSAGDNSIGNNIKNQIVNQGEEEEEDEREENDKIVSAVIKQVTKLLPTVTAPQARATILWILAEFCDKNLTAAKCAPNVLRSIAKTFCQEDNFVKLQSLTLASKFLLSLDKDKKAELYKKVLLLTGYLFSLAKYDINHDVRDRGRFLKKLLDDENICSKVLNCAN